MCDKEPEARNWDRGSKIKIWTGERIRRQSANKE